MSGDGLPPLLSTDATDAERAARGVSANPAPRWGLSSRDWHAQPEDESCPGCGTTTGVERIEGTAPEVRAWSCGACGMHWAMTVVNPHLRPPHPADLAAAVEEIGRLRRTLRALAGDAPTITERLAPRGD